MKKYLTKIKNNAWLAIIITAAIALYATIIVPIIVVLTAVVVLAQEFS